MYLNTMENPKLCRLCLLESEELLSIDESLFSQENRGKDSQPANNNNNNNCNIQEFLEMMDNIGFRKLEEEFLNCPLPSYVCLRCFKATRDAYEFKVQCQKTLEVIGKWWCNDNIPSNVIKVELNSDCDIINENSIQSPQVEIQTIDENPCFKGATCTQCICILRNYTNRLKIDEWNIENHSEYGYFKSNRCPFCSTLIKNSQDFSQHLNDIHHMAREVNNSVGHFFCVGSVFIYEFREQENANCTNTTKNSEDNEVVVLEECPVQNESEELNDDNIHVRSVENSIQPSTNSLRETELKSKKVKLKKKSSNSPRKRKQKSSSSPTITHECGQCQKTFSTRYYLQKHQEKHHGKRFVCKECNESFDSRAELNAHVKLRGHDKPLLCPECGLLCQSSNILKIHSRRHTGEKPYNCRYCSKAFARSYDLRVHEKYHTNEKSHFCEICGKGFQRKYNLTIHMRVHTGEKPYSCPQCPQAFAQSNDLKAHIRRHTGERLLCELCDATFLLGHQIRHHKLVQHGIIDVPLTQRLKKFQPIRETRNTNKNHHEQGVLMS